MTANLWKRGSTLNGQLVASQLAGCASQPAGGLWREGGLNVQQPMLPDTVFQCFAVTGLCYDFGLAARSSTHRYVQVVFYVHILDANGQTTPNIATE